MQEAIILILFAGALFYVGRTLFKSTKAEGGCSTNCGCDSPVKHLKKGEIPRH